MPRKKKFKNVKYSLEQQAWIDSRPENVRKVIETHPPIGCYRGKENRGHYVLHSYDEELDGTVTLKVDHLNDSFLPGYRVFGVKPESLIFCGCLQRPCKKFTPKRGRK